jgi:hypothetical protein
MMELVTPSAVIASVGVIESRLRELALAKYRRAHRRIVRRTKLCTNRTAAPRAARSLSGSRGWSLGVFLRAVVAKDLKDAIGLADEYNRASL